MSKNIAGIAKWSLLVVALSALPALGILEQMRQYRLLQHIGMTQYTQLQLMTRVLHCVNNHKGLIVRDRCPDCQQVFVDWIESPDFAPEMFGVPQ